MGTSLADFSKEFMELVTENSVENHQSVEQQLTEDIIDYIKEEGLAFSPEPLCCENTQAKPRSVEYYKINAFDYSEDSGILDLFTTVYIPSEGIPELTESRIMNNGYNPAVHFFSNILTDNTFAQSLINEDKADAAELVELIRTEYKQKHVKLLRVFILSNGYCKTELNLSNTLTFGENEIDCEVYIWDMETVRKSDIASRSDGAIDIDFATYYNHPIECLVLEESNGVKSYLAIMPAIILAKVFGEYKARLLNQNVRNYLGGKIKVNKGMAETLRKNPGLFFAYNNGISSTANSVSTLVDERTGKTVITNIRNWQIVNGGQTTNTIYRIYKEDPSQITNVFVTMKLSEIRLESDVEKARATSNIARFANSQTQIKESDLSANIDYMVKLQELSRSEWVPATSANAGTKWFFERMRGQYEPEGGDKKTKKYKAFTKEYPKKTQRFLKTDLAKWEMAWYDKPHVASKGGEQCYDAFYNEYLKKDTIDVTQEYYHNLIAKAIIYQEIAKINKANGVKANINILCNYVLAAIAVKSKHQLDLDYIWEHQEIHPNLRKFILDASTATLLYIETINQNNENPSVKAKNESFWKALWLRMTGLAELDKCLIKSKPNELSDIQKKSIAEFEATDLAVWKDLAFWGKNTKKLSLVERKRIDHIISFLETDREIQIDSIENALNILKKSTDIGFVIQLSIIK